MAKWHQQANASMLALPGWSGLGDSETAQLKSDISAWADSDPAEDSHFFPFGRFKKGGLRARLRDGWIVAVDFEE